MARLAVVVLCVGLTGAALADEKEEADLASKSALDELAHWKVTQADAPLERTSKPVLRWSNPQAGRVYGDVYFLLRNGSPAAAVCVYRYFTPFQSLTAEWASLSEQPLRAERDGKLLWNPEKPGLAFAPVAGAPVPGGEKAERLQQMRSLAREFTIQLTDKRNAATGEPQSLRLLTQPVFRQEATSVGSVDSAVFAYVVGTDPEAFLVLNASREQDGKAHWTFAFARMNRDALTARRGGKDVWKVPEVRGTDDPKAAYLMSELPKLRE